MASHSPVRLGFIDQLRGWAVIVMIEVHTFNDWLDPDLKGSQLWKIITFINGLVAPSFVFLAGFSLSLAAMRKWEQYTRPNLSLAPRFRHLLLILAVGYLLHFPARTWKNLVDGVDPVKLQKFFAVDVLQLIVVSLIVLHVLLFFMRSRAMFRNVAFVLGAVVFLATPFMYHLGAVEAVPLWLAAYLNKGWGSLFPLFPWSGLVFFGAAFGMVFAEEHARENGPRTLLRFAWIGLALFAAGWLIDQLPVIKASTHWYWTSSPEFNIIRLGTVLLLLAGMAALERRFHVAPAFVKLVGQESFLVYALHLFVLYGVFNGVSFSQRFAGSFNYGEAFVGYLALLLPMLAAAWAWRAVKQRSALAARIVMTAGVTFVLILFFFVL
jgi:uncharacterized membrane protein